MSGDIVGTRITIELDHDRLPSSIELEPLWRRTEELGARILDAYRMALWRNTATSTEAPNWDSLTSVLTRRQQALTLLHSHSLRHHHDIVNNAHDPQVYSFGGDIVDATGRPAVYFVADSTLLTDVVIDPNWAATASDIVVVAELLTCVDRIRARRTRTRFVGERPELSDDDVIALYRSHISGLAVDDSRQKR